MWSDPSSFIGELLGGDVGRSDLMAEFLKFAKIIHVKDIHQRVNLLNPDMQDITEEIIVQHFEQTC
jgi:hypothetical protein